MRCRFLNRVMLLLALMLLGLASKGSAAFTTSGRSLLRDGAPFAVRGVDYQPAPIGDNPSLAPPYGDYFTATYAALQARDLPLLRAMGANVIRIYGWDPTANHAAFLDACFNGGVDPVFVLVNRWIDPATNWANPAAVNVIRQEFLILEANLAQHPAVLGLILGNETNAQNGNGTNAAFWSAINSIAASLKQQNLARLVSMAVTDALPQIAARDSAMTSLDFWSVQVYRGTTFGTFFTQYAAASPRPLVVTEFGLDAFNQTTSQPYPDNAAFAGDTIAALWSEIATNAATCAGGCVFEFTDEWWKSAGGSATAHDPGGFAVGGVPDGFLNEEWWGLFAVADQGAAPDVLVPRAAVERLRALWMPPTIVIVAQPVSQTIAPGGATTLTITATASDASPLQYQWLKDDVALPGATSASLVVSSLLATDSGRYAVRVQAGATTATSDVARLLVAIPEPGQLINLSVRSPAGANEATLIAGVVVVGGAVPVLLRGIGPGLEPHGVSTFLPDPRLTLFSGSTSVDANDNWSDAPTDLAPVFASVSAFPLAAGSRDAALVAPITGERSMHVTSVDGSPGIALAEVYATTTGAGHLANVSARTHVGVGADVLIVGFVIDGNVPRRLLLRGVGPGLIPYHVTGVLADPVLHVFDAGGAPVASNDDWRQSPDHAEIAATSAAIGAFPLAADSHDAVVLRTLVPGLFTAQVSGVAQTTGVALVEVYAAP